MTIEPTQRPPTGWREQLYEVIFESETPAGRAFDLTLASLILLSVLSVILESVRSIGGEYGHVLNVAEWVFTVIFTVEYILRLIAVRSPLRYTLSFYGIIDFVAVFPSYISLSYPAHSTSWLFVTAMRKETTLTRFTVNIAELSCEFVIR